MKLESMQASTFSVLALAASAGGHRAIATILQSLPPEFPLAIVAMQHLPPEAAYSDELYRRLAPFAVEWVQKDSVLSPGKVLLCPPRSFVELLPDGTFVLSPNERGAVAKPIDRFLESVASSFGAFAIGVVLTGMGSDGATGARALHQAGGRVLVQSEATSEFPDMPQASIAAGAADLVAPLQDLAQVIQDLLAGTPQPQPRAEIQALRAAFGDEGQIAALAREINWSRRAIGPVRDWSPVLRSVLRLAIDYPMPYRVFWGPQLIQFYNDASLASQGEHHPHAFGLPVLEGNSELRELQGNVWQRALAGETVRHAAMHVPLLRAGKLFDAWYDVVYSPVRETDGAIGGVTSVWTDRTDEVLAARRLQTINRLATAPVTNDRREALRAAFALLQESDDVALAAAYLVDEAKRQALLGAASGVEAGGAMAPQQVAMRANEHPWPFAQVVDEGRPVTVENLPAQFHNHMASQDQLTPGIAVETAVICPLRDEVEGRVAGVLVLGTNPRLLLDEHYRAFLTVIGETIAAKVAESHARARERERMERMAELDRTKTEFFANVSHEFRTPLTLLLGPLEDLQRQRDALPAALAQEVEIAAANGQRLLRLVNSLLDFSQLDARRQQPNFEPVDLCALTTDIASAFRSAFEAAGLRYRVECDPHLPPVWVDREMWEKIVSNLLSNAFKFTFAGEIAVELQALSLHAELTVRDTGIGIPEQELPNLFKRFHRVRGARARTVEGAGIGLAIVEELVKRLGGQLTVRSQEQRGSSFTIWIPYKSVRIRDDGATPAAFVTTNRIAAELSKDAERWLVDAGSSPAGVVEDLLGAPPAAGETSQGRLLVADDNADMRTYLQRLLSHRWDVELAADGEAALQAAKRLPPDVIVADVMMPGLDGFELIQRVREDLQLKHTPIVLLTARAGEETAIHGLQAGADDYIAKPFSPRELVARLQAVGERGRAEAALRESAEKYRTLFDSIDEGFCTFDMIFDDAGVAVDYRFVEYNPAFERHTGLMGAVGRTVREFLPDQDRHWFEIYGRVAMTGEPIRVIRYGEALKRWIEVYAFRLGRPQQRRVAAIFSDVTARKEAELSLQASEERQAFLLRLSDALRTLTDPRAIQAQACRLLGEHLGVDRAYYVEVDEAVGEARVHQNYLRGDSPSLVGTFPLAQVGWTVPYLRQGQTVVVENSQTAAIVPDADRGWMAALQMHAHISMPIIKEGVLMGALCVTEPAPRPWTEMDVELTRETGERIWAALMRASAEAALRQLNETLEEQVRARTEQVRALVTQLTMSEQEERRRISAILHDDLQQRLFSVNAQLEMLRQMVHGQGADEARQMLDEIGAAVRAAVQVTRSLSVSLSPPVLHNEGLYEAVRWLASLMEQQHGLAVEVKAEETLPNLDEDLRVLLFQTIRELLFNVVKHAGVAAATVTLACSDGELRIEVSDDGCGFDPSTETALVSSQGLLRAQRRLQLLGGRVQVQARRGEGTRVAISVPRQGEKRDAGNASPWHES